jgi:hypothetical protein
MKENLAGFKGVRWNGAMMGSEGEGEKELGLSQTQV